jgi:hypothetical protein
VRPWLVLLVAAGLAVLVPGLAMADNVVVSVQIVGGSRTVTIPSGGSATVSYYIEATGPSEGDPQGGCNASDRTPATLTFYVGSTQLGSGTTPVAASPASLRFTACRRGNTYNDQQVTFPPAHRAFT